MVIEVKKDRKIQGEQLFQVIVDGEVIYGNYSYEDVIAITIGDLDKGEELCDMQDMY